MTDLLMDKAHQILRLDFETQREKAKVKIMFSDLKNQKVDIDIRTQEFEREQNQAICTQDLNEHC